MVIFYSYVSLPEGILPGLLGIVISHSRETPQKNPTMRWDREILTDLVIITTPRRKLE